MPRLIFISEPVSLRKNQALVFSNRQAYSSYIPYLSELGDNFRDKEQRSLIYCVWMFFVYAQKIRVFPIIQ